MTWDQVGAEGRVDTLEDLQELGWSHPWAGELVGGGEWTEWKGRHMGCGD